MQQLQTFGGLDEDALLGGLSRTYHDGHGGSKTQSAGAGDHQHGDGDGEAEADIHAPHEGPQQGRRQGDGHDRRHEDAADAVCQPGDGGLGGGGLLHEPDDLGEGGVAAHPGGPQLQITGAGDSGRGDGVAGDLLHRQALTGDGGFIHGGVAVGDDAVHGDAAALTDDDGVTGHNLLRGDGELLPLTAHHGALRGQSQQGGDGTGGLAAGALLQILAHRHQRQDHTGGLEVQVRHTGYLSGGQQAHFNEAVYKASRSADGHQRVHVGAELHQAGEAHGEVIAVENENGDHQRQLQAAQQQRVRMQHLRQGQAHHVAHAQVEQRHQKYHRPDEVLLPAAEGGVLIPAQLALIRLGGRGGPVARRLYGGDDVTFGDRLLVVGDGHTTQHQVHRGALHAAEPGDRLFHMSRAGGAGHAGHGKLFGHHRYPLTS